MSLIYSDNNNQIVRKINATGSIEIPSTVTKICANASADSKISSITFAENSCLTELEQETFYNATNLKIMDMTNCKKLSTIPVWCFGKCTYLETLLLPQNGILKDILSGAFFECLSLPEIIIPSTVVYFEDCTFDGGAIFHSCIKLKHIYFGSKSQCNHLGMQMFFNCVSLESIIIPPLVRELPDKIFHKCANLNSVIVFHPNPIVRSDIFYDIENNQSIYIHVTTITAYKQFANIGANQDRISIIPYPTCQMRDSYIPRSMVFIFIQILS